MLSSSTRQPSSDVGLSNQYAKDDRTQVGGTTHTGSGLSSTISHLTQPRLFQVRLGTQSFTLQHDLPYVIGSGSQANIEVSDRTIPARAATIRNDQLIVHEGMVHLNGRAIQSGSQAATLRDGDVLKIGSTLITLVELSHEASAAQSQGLAGSNIIGGRDHNLGSGATGLGLAAAGGAGAAGMSGVGHEHPSSQAIKTTTSPSNSSILKSHVQDKDDGIDRSRYGESGIVGGKSLHSVDNIQHQQHPPSIVQPNQTAQLGPGTTVTAGALPLMVREDKNATVVSLAPGASTGSSVGALQDRPVVGGPSTGQAGMIGGVNSLDNSKMKFETWDLVQMMRDMVELGHLRMAPSADSSLTSTIDGLPLHIRQNMGSTEIKHWLRMSENERLHRIGGVGSSNTLNSSFSTTVTSDLNNGMNRGINSGTDSEINRDIDRGLIRGGLNGGYDTGINRGIDSDLNRGGVNTSGYDSGINRGIDRGVDSGVNRNYDDSLMRGVGSHDLQHDRGLRHSDMIRGSELGTTTGTQPGIASGVGQSSLNRSSGADWDAINETDLAYGLLSLLNFGGSGIDSDIGLGSGGRHNLHRWESSDLSTIMKDYADMYGERLDPTVEQRIPYMLDRLPSSQRSSLSVTDLKSWLQDAHHSRVNQPVSLTGGESGNIQNIQTTQRPLTEIDLIRSLIGMKWHSGSKKVV
mgnify:CR=1 FL=1